MEPEKPSEDRLMETAVPPASPLPESERLPEMLRPLFWETDFEQVSWRENGDYIIRRVLSAGAWEAVCWLRATVGNDGLRQWFERHKGRGLSSRQVRFWQGILDLPGAPVDAWLDTEGRRIWEGRGRG
jgi:hypothetical protein